MKLWKKLGFPLLFASLIGFRLASRSEGMAFSYASMAVMLVAMLLIVGSAFIRSPDEEPAAGGPSGPAVEREPSFPSPDGVQIDNPVPGWIYVVGLLTSAAGLFFYFTGPNGVSRSSVLSFALIPGGVLYIIGATFFYGDPADRRNILRGAVALVSFLMIVGGIMSLVLIAAGAFDPGQTRSCAALAVSCLLAGMGGAYYGMKYQQSAAGRAIGRELGFSDADGRISSDGVYDSKGVMNGVETLFNIEQQGGGRNYPAYFTLEVLCRCANSLDVKLAVKPDGPLAPLGISFGSLPRLPGVQNWDLYDVRCDRPESAQGLLAEARRGNNIFNDKAGFLGMSLRGSVFKFIFRADGYSGTSYVRRILQETSLLASLFH